MYFIYLPEAPSTSNFWILFLHWVVLPVLIDRLSSCFCLYTIQILFISFFLCSFRFWWFLIFYVIFSFLLYFIVTLFRRLWIWLHNFPLPYGREISFRCLIRMIYSLCGFFLYFTILLDFFFGFLWGDFQVDIVQPQHFGHVAWLDSLPLADIISSFVYILYNWIYIYTVQWFHFWVLNFWLEIFLAHWTN